jgi:hypothetical protein
VWIAAVIRRFVTPASRCAENLSRVSLATSAASATLRERYLGKPYTIKELRLKLSRSLAARTRGDAGIPRPMPSMAGYAIKVRMASGSGTLFPCR